MVSKEYFHVLEIGTLQDTVCCQFHFGTFHCRINIMLLLWRRKIKYGLLSNQLYERAQEHGGERDPWVSTNF